MHLTEIRSCWVCAGPLDTVLELPAFPLTGIYSRTGLIPDFPNFDQALMICPNCKHGQLRCILHPEILYGQDYGFRTSMSDTASRGSDFFAKFVDKLFPDRTFGRLLEFGCSDAVLLRLLRGKADRLLGVDPVLKGREDAINDEKIRVVGDRIENVNIAALLNGEPDLVVSQHTLEHLSDPGAVLRKLLDSAHERAVFVLELPCLDPLLEQYRFDHVFHQHTQYFSVQSIFRLVQDLGAEVIEYVFNHTYWGALLIAFQKRTNSGRRANRDMEPDNFPSKSVDSIRSRYTLFQEQMGATKRVLAGVDHNKLYGYGAALMLPVLGYHLQTDFSEFQAILDDDPAKAGLGYANLPVTIESPQGVDIPSSTICLTALDNRRPILRRLDHLKPRQIINPLCVI